MEHLKNKLYANLKQLEAEVEMSGDLHEEELDMICKLARTCYYLNHLSNSGSYNNYHHAGGHSGSTHKDYQSHGSMMDDYAKKVMSDKNKIWEADGNFGHL